jgi:3-phosphoshikimate 1-carboxyvinyltransferase
MTAAQSHHQIVGDPTELEPWPAPHADGPISAAVRLPGSKSATNRALLLAALSDTESVLWEPLRSRDTDLMADALRSLGTDIADAGRLDDAKAAWRVIPREWRADTDIDCGLAGTVMRFVPAAATLARATIQFDGDAGARSRPMSPLISALRQLGADIESVDGRLPFTIRATGRLAGGEATIDASASSQFVSALLLAAPRFDDGISLRHVGPSLPSAPHIAMTVDMLRDAGARVDDEPGTWRVHPADLAGREWAIEPDLSNAAPFLAAAVLTGGEVRIPGWPHKTLQPGDSLRDILTQFGAGVSLDKNDLMVRGTGRVDGVDLDLHDVGELTPVIAALCACAGGPSRLRGIAHLRGHETNRLAALATELTRFGCGAQETDDGLAIEPRPLRPAVFGSYRDHRMAQAGAVLGLVVPHTSVENIGTTGKTMPGFPEMWRAMLGSSEQTTVEQTAGRA